jgi:hypothetical protein
MVEYAVLLAQNSAHFMGGVGGNVVTWVSNLNWTMLGYVAAGLILLRIVVGAVLPTRRY